MSVRLRRVPKNKKDRPAKLPMPLPEAIDGGRWDIKQASSRREGLAELRQEGGGRLTVPLGGGEVERIMRLHEQAHAALTPRDPEAWDGVDSTVLQLCEDRRIHHALITEGFDLDALRELAPDMAIEWDRLRLDYQKAEQKRDKAGRSLKVIPPRAIVAARVMAAYETGLYESEFDAAHELDHAAAFVGQQLAHAFQGSKVRSFAEAKIAAEMLCELFGTPGEPDTSPDESESDSESEPMPYIMPGMLEALKRLREGTPAASLPRGFDEKTGDLKGSARPWPTMEIIEKPRPLRMTVKIRGGYRKLPDVRGRALRRVARLAQDGRVFRAKHPVRRRGGCVLIDCSGSMSLTSYDVEAILVALPAAIVATYNGSDSHGFLWVIARDGKRAREDDLMNGDHCGNVVDVPALEWLNKQKGPRYWICDGAVTEHDDQVTARVIATCHELQKSGKVIRVPHVTSLLDHEGWERIS